MAAPVNVGAVVGISGISRKRFTMDDDLFLLREVLAVNPFEDPKRWTAIMKAVNAVSQRGFTVRAVKERVELLLSLFKKDDREKLKKSGTEEQFTEKVRLLHDIVSMQAEFTGRRPAARQAATAARNEAAAAFSQHSTGEDASECMQILQRLCAEPRTDTSDAPASTTTSGDAPSTSQDDSGSSGEAVPAHSQGTASQAHACVENSRRKRKAAPGIDVLVEKASYEKKMREQQLQLEERRLQVEEEELAFKRMKYETEAALQRDRFEAQMDLERRRFQMELDDRAARRELEAKQANLMQFLLEELIKRK